MYKNKGKTIILDPAPYSNIPDDIFRYISIITPNRTEMEKMTGIKITDEGDSRKASKILLNKGVENVINKLDNFGVFLINKKYHIFIQSLSVRAVDTVGAGDAFNVGLAYGLSIGKDLITSVKIANLIGAISVTKVGAQDSLPTVKEVKEFILNYELHDVNISF